MQDAQRRSRVARERRLRRKQEEQAAEAIAADEAATATKRVRALKVIGFCRCRADVDVFLVGKATAGHSWLDYCCPTTEREAGPIVDASRRAACYYND